MEDLMEEVMFTTSKGRSYLILIDDFGEEITVTHHDEPVGSISLRFIEGADLRQPDSYHITHLALDGCRRQGVGRRCLQLHIEIFQSPITANKDDGMRRNDGSHLTGDGPAFIAKMLSEGIVSGIDGDSDYYDRFDE